jgi:branched-chain amino acid transport system substrate-binding protein
MTGIAAVRGKDLAQAATLAVDEANARGGVNGKRITLEVYDDGDQPDRARQLATKAAAEPNVIAVLGQVASSAAAAAGRYIGRRAFRR